MTKIQFLTLSLESGIGSLPKTPTVGHLQHLFFKKIANARQVTWGGGMSAIGIDRAIRNRWREKNMKSSLEGK